MNRTVFGPDFALLVDPGKRMLQPLFIVTIRESLRGRVRHDFLRAGWRS